jgi:hypothetical protein
MWPPLSPRWLAESRRPPRRGDEPTPEPASLSRFARALRSARSARDADSVPPTSLDTSSLAVLQY